MWLALVGVAIAADGIDVTAAMVAAKKPAWEAKGAALDRFLVADAAYRGSSWEDAAKGMLEALGEQPGCGKCLLRLSRSLSELGDPSAPAVVGRLLADFPGRQDTHLAGLVVYMGAEKFDEGLALATTSQGLWPDWIQGWTYGALSLRSRPGEIPALADRAAAAEVKAAEVACLRVLGSAWTFDIEGGKGHWETCKDAESDVVREPAEGWMALASGQWKKAVERAPRIDDDTQTRMALVLLRLEEGNPKAAGVLADKLGLDEPGFVDVAVARARAHKGIGLAAAASAALDSVFVIGWETSWNSRPVAMGSQGPDWLARTMVSAVQLRAEMWRAEGKEVEARALVDNAKKIWPKATI